MNYHNLDKHLKSQNHESAMVPYFVRDQHEQRDHLTTPAHFREARGARVQLE
jgi:hypothetical protein